MWRLAANAVVLVLAQPASQYWPNIGNKLAANANHAISLPILTQYWLQSISHWILEFLSMILRSAFLKICGPTKIVQRLKRFQKKWQHGLRVITVVL